MTKQIYTSKLDNHKITYYTWKVKNPKGILHLVHGSIDFALHYEALAEFMNKNGYLVYAMDLRGHGETGKKTEWGYFGKNGQNIVLDDIHNINKIIKKENKDMPIILMGHSMGSFIIRAYLAKYNDINAAIPVGTNHLDSFVNWFMFIVAKSLNGHKPGKLINSLSYSTFNNNFKEENDTLAWLSKNKDNKAKNKDSKYTKFIMTNDAFVVMSRWIKIYKTKKLHTNKIPILLLNGSEDPVGKNGKEVRKAYKFYKNLGYDTTHIEYKKLRHEVLNEDEIKVFNDILKFLNKVIKKK